MSPEELALFLGVVAVCAWLQAVSGFALALGLLGMMTEFDLASIPVTAVVVSLVGLASSLVSLAGVRGAIQWRRLVPILLGMLPTVGVGVWLMDRLAHGATSTLQVILGAFIVLGGVLMLMRPTTRERPARPLTGFLSGLLGGLFGGLFAAVAPPVVYHLYREPMTVDAVRATLHALIVVGVAMRMSFVSAFSEVQPLALELVLYALPVVVLGTLAGRHFMPELSGRTQRRIAVVLLMALGVPLLFA
ncbi:MAG: sulfite exporter TauE/SafE family protein [Gammaproteobacteria bacterium]|nr:sulfite exporter TauE/SafE family protein [Gammaproteobacteria bacterium]